MSRRVRRGARVSSGPARLARQKGFSLVELLVAVLVMGVGILGVGALQLQSLQDNRTALTRVEAVNLAWDMLDRIRANPGGRAGYGDVTFDSALPQASDCGVADCDPMDMAAYDVRSWKCQLGRPRDVVACTDWRVRTGLPSRDLAAGLPSGDGAVSIRGSAVQVTVRWKDQSGQSRSVLIVGQV